LADADARAREAVMLFGRQVPLYHRTTHRTCDLHTVSKNR
jgi:hypothetical protein